MKGQYICKNNNCQLFDVEFEVAQNCPLCKLPLSFVSNFTDFEKDIIDNYPYLIAFPFKRMLEEGNYHTKCSILKDVFVNTLKYHSLIIASEYFKSPFKSEEINTLFEVKLARPNHGHWNQFLDKTIDFLETQNHSFFVKELPFAYHLVESERKSNLVKKYLISKEYTDNHGRLIIEKIPMTAIRALLYYRNEKLAHAQTLKNDIAQNLFATCYPILGDFLEAMSFCKDYKMFKADRKYFYSLMSTKVIQSGILTKKVNQEDNVWLEDSQGNRMSLLPFFVQPSQYIAGANKEMEILMYEGNTGTNQKFRENIRIIFDSPESVIKPEAQGEILNKFYDLIQRKKVFEIFTTKTFRKYELRNRIRLINNKIYKELTDEQKLIQGVYQKREDIETELLNWIGTKSGFFFLAAKAGMGKTNLLWDIKRQYETKNYDSLILRASRFVTDELENELKRLFYLSDDFVFSNSEAFKYTFSRPLVILIDGCNEHVNPQKLMQSIFSFLEKFTIGSIKIVLSWRINSSSDLPQFNYDWERYFYNSNYSNNENDIQKRVYWLQPFNKHELQSAWYNYINNPKERKYKVLFTFNELSIIDRALSEQLNNPLVLKLFLELFNGKLINPKNNGYTSFWLIWWNQRIENNKKLSEFIIHLSILMVNEKQNRLPLDLLYEDFIIGKHIRNYQIDSPYQQLLNDNVLTQFSIDDRLYVSFTIETIFHYTLCQYLKSFTNYNEKLVDFFLKGLYWENALVYYLIDEICNNKIEFLLSLISNEKINPSVLAQPFAILLEYSTDDNLMKRILKNAGEFQWKVIFHSLNYLWTNQKLKLLNEMLESCKEYLDFASNECCFFISTFLHFVKIEYAEYIAYHFKSVLEDETQDLDLKLTLMNGLIDYYLYQKKDFNQAMVLVKRKLDVLNFTSKDSNLKTIIALEQLAWCYEGIGEYESALQLFLDIPNKMKLLELDNVHEAHVNSLIAGVYERMKDYNSAYSYYYKSLNLYLNFCGHEHSFVGICYNNLGYTLLSNLNFVTALEYFNKALKIYIKLFEKDNKYLEVTLGNIQQVYISLANSVSYFEDLNKCIDLDKNLYGEQHPHIAFIFRCIAVEFNKRGNYDESLYYAKQSLNILLLEKKKNYLEFTRVHNLMGWIYYKKLEDAEALNHFERFIDAISKTKNYKSNTTIDIYKIIGTIYKKMGMIVNAILNYQKANELCFILLGKEHEEFKAISTEINQLNELKVKS